MTELARCTTFLRELALGAAHRTVDGRFGPVLLNDEFPRVWSLNYLLAEQDLAEATAEVLADEAERLLGGAGRGHRKIEILDGETGARLEPAFRELGWHVERDLVMPHGAAPDQEPDTAAVEEVTADDLAPVWASGIRSEPFGRDEEVVRQLVEYKRVIADAVNTRFFAARADGEAASYCDLYSHEGIGQIEAVMTLPRFRNRGLARGVVWKAFVESKAAGNDLTFLLADEADWPQELYRKLGFEPVGRVFEFTRPRVV